MKGVKNYVDINKNKLKIIEKCFNTFNKQFIENYNCNGLQFLRDENDNVIGLTINNFYFDGIIFEFNFIFNVMYDRLSDYYEIVVECKDSVIKYDTSDIMCSMLNILNRFTKKNKYKIKYINDIERMNF